MGASVSFGHNSSANISQTGASLGVPVYDVGYIGSVTITDRLRR